MLDVLIVLMAAVFLKVTHWQWSYIGLLGHFLTQIALTRIILFIKSNKFFPSGSHDSIEMKIVIFPNTINDDAWKSNNH